jgi:hypothetical protein
VDRARHELLAGAALADDEDRMAWTAVSSVPNPLMSSTSHDGFAALNACRTSSPESGPFKLMSDTTRSNGLSWARPIAIVAS